VRDRPLPLSRRDRQAPHRAALLAAALTAAASSVVVPALVQQTAAADLSSVLVGDPPGANDWTCKPTARHPRPVILVHGTFGDRQHLLEVLSSRLSRAGYCVFSLDYGNRATGRIQDSAQQLSRFTQRVLTATGARKVSMVGHSQGGLMPRYYIKNLGGAQYVDDLIGIAPSNHGTTILTSSMFAGSSGSAYSCGACEQQVAGSTFLRRLNAGDETPGAVDYTTIVTQHDEVVVPYTSGYLEGGRDTAQLTNVALQDTCPVDPSDHVTVPMSATTYAWVADALAHDGPANPRAAVGCGAP
jgi:triacylglycerol esterase/lipase EstA (alpha/beta hydrolase family)